MSERCKGCGLSDMNRHAGLVTKESDEVEYKAEFIGKDVWMCPTCGYTELTYAALEAVIAELKAELEKESGKPTIEKCMRCATLEMANEGAAVQLAERGERIAELKAALKSLYETSMRMWGVVDETIQTHKGDKENTIQSTSTAWCFEQEEPQWSMAINAASKALHGEEKEDA